MKSSYEENYKELQKVNLEVDKLKEELDELNSSISSIRKNYPDGTIYDLLSSDKSIEDYKKNVMKLKEYEQVRENKNAEYIEKLNEQELLQTLVDNYIENLKEKINNNREKINERKLEKERKAQELENAKQEFKNYFVKTMSKPGLLNEKVASKLLNDIISSKCLSEQEKSEYRNKINNRLTENEEIIIKESKVKTEKKLIVKNKFKCVVAKGKEATINTMKNVFNKSIGKVVNGVKGIYQKFCDKVTKNIQEELDYSFGYIENLINQMEEMNVKHQEEINNLKENINNLENHISRQEDLNSAFDTDINIIKNEQKKDYTDEEILNEMSNASINAQEEQMNKVNSLNENKNDSIKYMSKQEKPEINKIEEMNNEVYTGEVLSSASKEVKNAIDIDAKQTSKSYYEQEKKRLEAQKKMYAQIIGTENNSHSMGM